jgi:hypothetical protein
MWHDREVLIGGVLLLACVQQVLAAASSRPLEQVTVEAPPKDSPIEARFVAEVKWIEMIGKREATVVPIGVDVRWLVGIEIRSIEKAAQNFERKGHVVLAIHSPVRLFRKPREQVPGKSYSFKVSGRVRDGRPAYHHAQVTEQPQTGDRTPGE